MPAHTKPTAVGYQDKEKYKKIEFIAFLNKIS